MVQEIFVLGLFPTPEKKPGTDETNYIPFKDSNKWMFLICIPMVLNFYLIFALLFIHPHDSIDYNIKQGNYKKAKEEISRVYSKESKEN